MDLLETFKFRHFNFDNQISTIKFRSGFIWDIVKFRQIVFLSDTIYKSFVVQNSWIRHIVNNLLVETGKLDVTTTLSSLLFFLNSGNFYVWHFHWKKFPGFWPFFLPEKNVSQQKNISLKKQTVKKKVQNPGKFPPRFSNEMPDVIICFFHCANHWRAAASSLAKPRMGFSKFDLPRILKENVLKNLLKKNYLFKKKTMKENISF